MHVLARARAVQQAKNHCIDWRPLPQHSLTRLLAQHGAACLFTFVEKLMT
jgi:hypothetical protein